MTFFWQTVHLETNSCLAMLQNHFVPLFYTKRKLLSRLESKAVGTEVIWKPFFNSFRHGGQEGPFLIFIYFFGGEGGPPTFGHGSSQRWRTARWKHVEEKAAVCANTSHLLLPECAGELVGGVGGTGVLSNVGLYHSPHPLQVLTWKHPLCDW